MLNFNYSGVFEMELVREEKNKKIFVEGNKTFYVANMGSYVGHRNRQWYSSKPEVWILMGMDEKCQDGEILHIEALVDDRGDYMRFIMQKGDIKRVLQLQNGRVYSDSINDAREGKDLLGMGKTYSALDGDIYSDEQIPLYEYLSLEQRYTSNGETYDGEVPNNDVLKEYMLASENLRAAQRKASKR